MHTRIALRFASLCSLIVFLGCSSPSAEGESSPAEGAPAAADGDSTTPDAAAPSHDATPPGTDAASPPSSEDGAAPPPPGDAAAPPPSGDGAAPPPSGDAAAPPPPPACGSPPSEPPSTPPASPPSDLYPMIRHWEKPSSNVVALTFDDGPSPGTTDRILDTLKEKGIRATFFVNSRATVDLRTNAAAKALLARIVGEGHVLGSHTANHHDLTSTSTDVDAQLRLLEEDVKASHPCAPPLTLVRAPFGQPYLSGSDEAKARVFPIVAKHGVHVGWSIEALDWTCAESGPSCIVNRVMERIDLGRRGAILLHDTQKVTADALPALIAEIQKRGITFVTAEKLVRDKYGKTSAELVAAYKAKTGS